MNLIIKKELLLKGVNIVEHILGRNLTLPILNNILIRADKNKLNLISTDLEIAVSVYLVAKIEEEGDITIPSILSSFLANLPEGNINLKSSKNILYLKQNNYKTTLKGESSEEYPIIPPIQQKEPIIIHSSKFVAALKQVINSTAISDLKPELTGIFFYFNNDELKSAATDSFRLSEKTTQIKSNTIKRVSKIIIPRKTAQEIIKIYQNLDDDLYLYIDENQISVENNKNSSFYVRLTSKLIEGEYPEYSQIIPQKYLTKIILSKNDFITQIKSASLFARKTKDIKLNIFSKKIEIHSEDYDIGDFNSSIDADVEGEEKEITLNYQYLLDGLDNISGDEVVIKINQKDGPVLMEPTKHRNYLYILMPIRAH